MDRSLVSSARLHILVVDDDVACLESLEDLLRGDGHTVTTATRGEEAVEKARRLHAEELEGCERQTGDDHSELLVRPRFRLSILDYHVPDLNGLETYERLCVEVPRLGAIFISGDASEQLETEALSAGAFAFVRKPLDTVRVREVVDEYCWYANSSKPDGSNSPE